MSTQNVKPEMPAEADAVVQSELIEPLGVAAQMRMQNQYHTAMRPDDWLKPFAEVDIRFAEFIDWLHKESQRTQDAVTLALHLTVAFHAKYNPMDHPPVDDEILSRVEETMQRLGVDFLYPLNP